MEAKIEDANGCKKVISAVIKKEEIQKEFDKVLANYKKDVHIEGFRKGKVPQNVIIQRYGERMIMDAGNKLISQSLYKFYVDNKMSPVAEPAFEDVVFNVHEISDISFKAIVEIDPVIEIKDYKNLGIKVEEVSVDEKEIDAAMTSIKNQRAELNETEGPIKTGDIVELKYENVVIDGEKTEKLPAPRAIEIGYSPLPELNKELLGLKKGETKEIKFVFPEHYPLEGAAGKNGSINVEVANVRAKTFLPLDEEYFKSIGAPAKNEEELRAIVKDNAIQKKKNEAREAASQKAIGKLLERNSFLVPEGRIKYYINNVRNVEQEYFNEKNPQPSFEEYMNQRRGEAERSIRSHRILTYIAVTENIKVSQEEVDTYIMNYAKMYGQDFESLKEAIRKSGEILKIREELRFGKTLNCLTGIISWEDAAK